MPLLTPASTPLTKRPLPPLPRWHNKYAVTNHLLQQPCHDILYLKSWRIYCCFVAQSVWLCRDKTCRTIYSVIQCFACESLNWSGMCNLFFFIMHLRISLSATTVSVHKGVPFSVSYIRGSLHSCSFSGWWDMYVFVKIVIFYLIFLKLINCCVLKSCVAIGLLCPDQLVIFAAVIWSYFIVHVRWHWINCIFFAWQTFMNAVT